MKINKIEMNGYTLYHIPNKNLRLLRLGHIFLDH